ncbi:MAG TPA: hypothetical protein VK508_13865 [Cyclobacteriaceae bacterium]|nr:hypothetical protein [Cyclobacteriaceae bacterium]
MKIPGLFTKAAKYHKFEYKPRYFDPKKEEHEAREDRIRAEIAKEKGEALEPTTYDYHTRMKGTFQAARKRSAPSSGEPNYAIIRIGILLLISLLLFGFFQWGGKVVYALFLIFPIWIYLRFFRKPKQVKDEE